MDLHTIKSPVGSKKKCKRLGHGTGSGTGKTSGRGHRGMGQRSGYNKFSGHEGGQMPLHRRIPKFGFANIFKKEFQIVNLSSLNLKCEQGEVTVETLKDVGLVKKTNVPVKILGGGNVDKAFTVKAAVFSKSAKAKLEEAGGKAEVV
ncbi:MAG: 50S ribosomal protein L15 [candidate division Zixibacteria bacterium]|nr:50S ribosomal protein L15 [candidate division Zixibacteria bacterium]